MQRHCILPRINWQEKVESIGFHYSKDYWNENVCYSFKMNEIQEIERVTNNLYQMVLETTSYIIDNKLYDKLKIIPELVPFIEYSWETESLSLYGRFDFCYKNNQIKLYECNFDTPTSLLESSVIQWYWLQDYNKNLDQFNSIHERLVNYWENIPEYLKNNKMLHFTATDESIEDISTTLYLQDTAIQAQLQTEFLNLEEIGYDYSNNDFIDNNGKIISNIFKLYPWEWLITDDFGKNIDLGTQIWIEPAWKCIPSNKAFMAIMYDLFPNHPNLLKTSLTPFDNNFCKKPIISREGQNITLYNGCKIAETNGEYGEEGFVYQELCVLPEFDNHYPLIGSWIIDEFAAGIGIRESNNLITDNTSCFIPHYIED